jgi:PAS domain S-box-containing protein
MLAAAGFYGVVAIYAWRRRSVPGALPFAIAVAMYVPFAGSAALVLAAADPSTKIFWTEFQMIWILPSMTAMLCFLLEYANLSRWLSRRTLILLAIPPFVFAVLATTNDAHHMVWTDFLIEGYVHPVRAWAGWAATAYGYTVGLANSIIVVWLFIRSPLHRVPAAMFLFGQLVGRVVFLLEAGRVNPVAPMDPVVVSSAFTVAMYALALFRLRMFDLVPVARGTMIEQMREGVLVLDSRQHIVDLNPAAARILGIPAVHARGSAAVQVLPEYSGLTARIGDPGMVQAEISRGTGGDARNYTLNVSSLKHRRGFQLGYLILLQDVTELERAQGRVLEQQRALATLQERDRVARELHDGLGQVLGFVKMQALAVRSLLARGHGVEADRYQTQLAAVVQDAHADVREYILGARTGGASESGFLPALESYLQRFKQNYGITTKLTVAPELTEAALTPMVEAQLLRIIQEALTNVRKHAHTGGIHITLHVSGNRAEAIVEDEGTGFDPALLQATEGQTFGLRFMQERAAEVGGSVTIHSAPGEGTQVIVSVPLDRSRHESTVSR